MTTTDEGTSRPLHRIADDITRYWPEPAYPARPYIYAMRHLATMEDMFGSDDAEGVVVRFLVNAAGWRGEHARRIKAELRTILRQGQP